MTEILIPQKLKPGADHRKFGCEIIQAQFGGAGYTLPYIISAEIFNKRCKKNAEKREEAAWLREK